MIVWLGNGSTCRRNYTTLPGICTRPNIEYFSPNIPLLVYSIKINQFLCIFALLIREYMSQKIGQPKKGSDDPALWMRLNQLLQSLLRRNIHCRRLPPHSRLPKMKIAVEGCCHGELDAIYASLQRLERDKSTKVDLLLIGGDFQVPHLSLSKLTTSLCGTTQT
jgi:hypothetical protein